MAHPFVQALAPPHAAEPEDAVAAPVLALAALAVTSAVVGAHWDISWHQSIGRDTFWSPPHLAIHLCGVLTGLSCGLTILRATFSRTALAARAASVRLFGLRGPLGAFVSGWGGVAMMTSAPFDDWWHRTYGLDEKVLSPPHVVLVGGILAVQLGAVLLILGARNRAAGRRARGRLTALLLYLCGLALTSYLTFAMDFLFRPYMHSGVFYRTVMLGVPVVLAASWGAARHRWACTWTAAVYSLLLCALVWVLPLFPAQPRLGPVYVQVTHFVPPEFPLLVVPPALALDLLLARARAWPRPLAALAGGGLFFALFLALQWPFASFLLSPASRTAFFGTTYFGYGVPPTSPYFRHLFQPLEHTPQKLAFNLALALGLSVGGVWAGLRAGKWLERLQR